MSVRDRWYDFVDSRAVQWIIRWFKKRRIDNILYLWVSVPALMFLVYWIGTLGTQIFGGHVQEWQRWCKVKFWTAHLFPQGLGSVWDIPHAVQYATFWFWLWVALMSAISFLIWHAMKDDDHTGPIRETVAHVLMISLFVGGSFQAVAANFQNGKDAGRANSAMTTYVIADRANPPALLKQQFEGVEPGDGNPCLFVSGRGGKTDDGKTIHDTPSCIVEGSMDYHWEDRNGSASGAEFLLSGSSAGASNTYVMTKSLTYLYGDKVGEGKWAALRDGKNGQGADSVAYVDRNNVVTTGCKFEGDYELKQSFSGRWSHNLRGLLASRFPTLLWNDEDVWAFCTPKATGPAEPVIVVLPTQFDGYNARAVKQAGGVIVVRGSATGQPRLKHYPNVGSDRKVDDLTLPGPVYPSNLAAIQRESAQWTAGQWNRNRGKFGFDTVKPDDPSQAGNVSEYLRRAVNPDGTPGRLFWVTDLTARHTDARVFQARAEVPADKAIKGTLNELHVYVYNDNDVTKPQNNLVVNLDDMTARVKNEISAINPGFFDAGGKVVEFNSRDGKIWLAYGEIDGRVKYRFEIPANGQIKPSVIDMDTGKVLAGPTQRADKGVCFEPRQMSAHETAACLKAIGEEALQRPDGSPSAPLPTPSASDATPQPTASPTG